MNIPPSAHFTPLPLDAAFNARREALPASLRLTDSARHGFGRQVFRGMPFDLGQPEADNVLLLDQTPVSLAVDELFATYLIFLHQAEDYPAYDQGELAHASRTGNELGHTVSDYTLEYFDGSVSEFPVLRRFAIQQSHIRWGASPFAAVEALSPVVFSSTSESFILGQMPADSFGYGETRHRSGRDDFSAEHLWLYALPNPTPDKAIRRIILTPRHERSAIYGLTSTRVPAHPLQPGLRQKLLLDLPDGVSLNASGDLDAIGLDLGSVIAAYGALDYDPAQWHGPNANAQPVRSLRSVIVEYASHPAARLYVGTDGSAASHDLAQAAGSGVVAVNPANRPVRLRIVERGSGRPVPARLHLHGQHGEYLPPRGHHRRVNPTWFEDNYAEFVNGLNQYSYVPGECLADLPLGEVFVEVNRGYEVLPLRRSLQVTPDTEEITLEVERALHWRQAGWVTADTHVHFLSPQTALLEGQAEGVHVVNLLASQWGELFTNVGDFDGRTTLGAKEFGGDGEYLVQVGTENRMQVLGHISLLGYTGPMIHPLCTGGPSESAIGDAQEVTMAEWARQCIQQNGLVVMPHAPDPQGERAADILLGLVHALELVTFNPFEMQLNPAGLADWYRFLNLGQHVPVVGGSDKMAATMLLGGIRTYAHLGDREFTYDHWKDAVRAGNTFVTVGPLLELAVDGQPAGAKIRLPSSGGTLDVSWKVESVGCPVDSLEVVVGGRCVEQISLPTVRERQQWPVSASGSTTVKVDRSTWIALRVRGSYRGRPNEIGAHTSAVQILVEGSRLFAPEDAVSVLEQIEGSLTYLDTLAPRPEVARFKHMRAALLEAHTRLHHDLHASGIPHHNSPLHGQYRLDTSAG